jgi:hypothetical protein
MKTPIVIYWIAVLSLAYNALGFLVRARGGSTINEVLAIGLWLFLAWMLYRRPKKWGLGVGIFMLFAIAVQVGLWRLALAKKEELGLSDSWWGFCFSAAPLFVGSVCSISLRWLYPEKPNQSPDPTPLRGAGHL